MRAEHVYNGRYSYAGALCTARYLGPLSKSSGDWLGVEWDHPSRGKHDGTHEGKRMFRCQSSSPTAASFLRPSRKPDPERMLLEAIRFKYAPAAKHASDAADQAIEISGKVVEEIGFERVQKQLSALADLKIVLVDELVVSSIALHSASTEDVRKAQHELQQTCPNIVELDVGWNVIETWQDVVDMCTPFPKLKILKAGGLRLREFNADFSNANPLRKVEELHLNEGLLTASQILEILFLEKQCNFPSLRTLSLSLNELASLEADGDTEGRQCPSVHTVILENNAFTDLSSLPTLFGLFPGLTSLSLQGNAIASLGLQQSVTFPSLETLNIARNQISDYAFIDQLPTLFPNLTSLRISRNPLYMNATSAGDAKSTNTSTSGVEGPETSSATSDSTSYYLTLTRLPGLKSLNYTTITPREREEGEIYYLSVAEKEISLILEGSSNTEEQRPPSSNEDKVSFASQRHPLYAYLCAKYDRDDVVKRYLSRQSSSATAQPSQSQPISASKVYAPGTLGSRLVDAYIYLASSAPSTKEPLHRALPTTLSVYRLKSLVARHFSLPALRFKLVYESHEYDPVEPIQSTRNIGAGGGASEEAWKGWGDWDVDNSEGDGDGSGIGYGDGDGDLNVDTDFDAKRHTGDPPKEDESKNNDAENKKTTSPHFIIREGHRFKKRETEILDGMRPWGDFLDVDSYDASGTGRPGRKDVRIRVEPHVLT